MSEKTPDVTAASLGDILKLPTPVLVDFWAPWCGPCKALAPALEELARELAGKISIVKVNVDNEDELAASYSVRAVPTLIAFKGGKEVERFIGVMDAATLKAKVLTLL